MSFEPGGNVKNFHAVLEEQLLTLGFTPSSKYQVLHEIAVRFLVNRQLDISPTDLSIIRDIADACDRPASRLGAHMLILGDGAIDAICGEFPGHALRLETLDAAPQAAYLPDHNAFFGEAIKNLWRRETTADKRGMVALRRPPHIAECIPFGMTHENQIKALYSLVDLIVEVFPSEDLWRQYLWGFGLVFLEFESLGTSSHESGGIVALRDAFRDHRLLDHLKSIIPAIVDRHHGRDDVAEVMSIRRFCFGTVALLMKKVDRKGKRLILKALADLFPEALRSSLAEAVVRLRSQYQIEGDSRGKQKSTHRWMHAHASWKLILEVMDALWPAEKGPLDRKSNAILLDIAYSILIYADPTIDAAASCERTSNKDSDLTNQGIPKTRIQRRANYDISVDDLSKIGSLRSNIYMLDEMLSVMNLRLAEQEKERLLEGSLTSAEEVDLRRRVEALQSWRREAQRRLRQGDWEKGKAAKVKKRATGPRVPIPAFSLELKKLPIEERIISASNLAFQAGL